MKQNQILSELVNEFNQLFKEHYSFEVAEHYTAIETHQCRISGVFLKDLSALAQVYNWSFSVTLDPYTNNLIILL